jgi:hypothetical protein
MPKVSGLVCVRCRRCRRYVRRERCYGCWCPVCYRAVTGGDVRILLVRDDLARLEREARVRLYQERAAAKLPLFPGRAKDEGPPR